MAADTFVGPFIEKEPGGNTLRVKSGGVVAVDAGGSITGTRIERKLISIVLPSATALSTLAGSGLATPVANTDLPLTVKSVKILSTATIAGATLSNATLTVSKVSSGATATTAVASVTFTTGIVPTAFAPVPLTLVTTAVSVASSESLIAKWSFTSSGLDVPITQLTVETVIDAV